MATTKNNNSPNVYNVGSSRETSNLLPQYFRTTSNKKFLQGTLDQLTQAGTVKKITGYLGRQFSKASSSSETFLQAASEDRQNYQLEPAAVIKDYLGNTTFLKDYIDHINHIKVADGIVNDHSRLNRQEYYSWDPHIDWDKFVNFRQYYWMPYGPDTIEVIAVNGETAVDVLSLVEQQKTCTLTAASGRTVAISNGMKLKFSGNVTPLHYKNSTWYVEGVGNSITLINAATLDASLTFVSTQNILFDDQPFDESAFSEGSFSNQHDYITINRASKDNNAWSRYNRWFHEDVIKTSAEVNEKTAVLDYSARGSRPIIEFEPNLVLHNFGLISKETVDVVDNYTTNVVEYINGSTGYVVDGVSLTENMRVLVTADTNPQVNNKIYRVTFVENTPQGRSIALSNAVIVGNSVQFQSEHGLETGTRVAYQSSNLSTSKTVYVKTINPTTIEIYANAAFTKAFFDLQVEYTLTVINDTVRVIELVEDSDAIPNVNDCVTVKYGSSDVVRLSVYNQLDQKVTTSIKGNRGLTYWFNGTSWVLGQTKSNVNIAPRFDVVDSNQTSFSDQSVYAGSDFDGTKIFSYKIGTGQQDKILKFPLSYKNINNVGDIVFNFDLSNSSVKYVVDSSFKTVSLSSGFLKRVNGDSVQLCNGWTVAAKLSTQAVVRVFNNSQLVNNFPIDMFDNVDQLSDLQTRVFINGVQLNSSEFELESDTNRYYVVLHKDAAETDIVTLKCTTSQSKNHNGFYEVPLSLHNNPLNEELGEFTLGQVTDHVESIVSNVSSSADSSYQGLYPGVSNLRDLGQLSPYGSKFVQHSWPAALTLYHLGSAESNLLKALEKAASDYNQFKRAFIIEATNLGIDTETKQHVDAVLSELTKHKSTSSAYYLSDMFGYAAANKISIEVIDERIKTYPISQSFSLNQLSSRSVNVYLNSVQLLHSLEFQFTDNAFIEVLVELNKGDLIEIYEYDSTDSSACPPTIAKLGIMPAYVPKIYISNAFLTPTKVIQGHDGSITVAFNDYRDDLILELEKRIYNNIKVQYNAEMFDIWNYIPGYNRRCAYTGTEYNTILSKFHYQWLQNVPAESSASSLFDEENPFTWNYINSYDPKGQQVPASWRGIYRWMFDTVEPHIKPWECLGFSIEPEWWSDVYGSAPYTSNNQQMWNDIANGVIADPSNIRVDQRFAKPLLLEQAPVDEDGNLLPPSLLSYISGTFFDSDNTTYKFGDEHTVEAAWRRSSYYPFAVFQSILLMHPCEVLSKCFDRSRIGRNVAGQLTYQATGSRISPATILTPTTANSQSARIFASGLVNFVVDYLTNERTDNVDAYRQDLKTLDVKISSRLGGFTSKEKYQLLLDSKNPSSTGSVFVPAENYEVALNTSSAIAKVTYSGIIVTKQESGYEVKGYSTTDRQFNCYDFAAADRTIQVGGISESFSTWATNRYYISGNVVEYNGEYYRTTVSHTSSSEFDTNLYVRLPSLPITGGSSVVLRKFKTKLKSIPYGTILPTIQDVANLMQGYSAFLEEQGFVFDTFNTATESVSNWESAITEFVFWSTQGWETGSAISFSPSASKLTFNAVQSVVDSLINPFYNYSILKVDGTPLSPENLSVYRKSTQFVIEPTNTVHGIYSATFYLVQKEHVLLLDSKTLFNDTIFDKPTGYRQEKIKAVGYVTSSWDGGLNIPGFVYDQATVAYWEPWTDYNLGDVVKYKEYYYSAKSFLIGADTFDTNSWARLTKKPTAQLIPNWDYRAEQFTDFYDLDSDNFDSEQQRIAQHLTGYQKRQYLENIINNDVSQYKFYQGMIAEKGTVNSLLKLFDVLSESDKESVTFDEEWAIRVGEYGAIDTFGETEIILDKEKFQLNPQPIEIVDTVNTTQYRDLVYRQRISDVYTTTASGKNIWPTKKHASYLRSTGYVSQDEVVATVNTLKDLTAAFIDSFKDGDYVHATFESTGWDVYRFSRVSNRVVNAVYNNTKKELTVEFDTSSQFEKNDVIGLVVKSETSINYPLNRFFVVKSANNNVVVLNLDTTTFDKFDSNSLIEVYNFVSNRIRNFDEADAVIQRVASGETVWVDENENSKWAVYKNAPCFSVSEVKNVNFINDNRLTSAIAITAGGETQAVSNASGITIFTRQTKNSPLALFQRIEFGKLLTETSLHSLAISKSGHALVSVDNNPSGVLTVFILKDNLYHQTVSVSVAPVVKKVVVTDGTRIVAISDSKVYVFDLNETLDQIANTIEIDLSNILDADITADGKLLIISSVAATVVYKYDADTGTFAVLQQIQTNGATELGKSVAIESTGSYFIITNPLDSSIVPNGGCVYVYRSYGTEFSIVQQIFSKTPIPNEQFGYSVALTANNTLVVNSLNYTAFVPTTFDTAQTTFDNETTSIVENQGNIGKLSVYDLYHSAFLFGESLDISVLGNSDPSKLIAVSNNSVVITSTVSNVPTSLITFERSRNTRSWTKVREQEFNVDVSAIKTAYIYNKKTKKIVKTLDVIDPVQGKIASVADREIKYKTYYDPATYEVGTEEVTVDDSTKWGPDQVGYAWWDLSTSRFVDYHTGSVSVKASNWNRLHSTASVDVYEWVESAVLPARWDAISASTSGLELGYSGVSKYGNKSYSTVKVFDTVTNVEKTTYYFWVKNKVTVPDLIGRSISVSGVARLIADPAAEKYSCVAFLGSNSLSLVNVVADLQGTDHSLVVQHWTTDATTSNAHSEWKLISTGVDTTIPASIETKWRHSLTGVDQNGQAVPDFTLPEKYRYGVENRVRQSMFVNRIQAVKQYIEQVNSVLKTTLIADTKNLSELYAFDQAPSADSGVWDVSVSVVSELDYVKTTKFVKASITPVVYNGSVVDVVINNPGKGYKQGNPHSFNSSAIAVSWFGPEVRINGTGEGAYVKSVVDEMGSIISCVIIEPGTEYTSKTTASVRSFAALVEFDENNAWTVYEYNVSSKQWDKGLSQKYNVPQYWNYIDWYSPGYSEYNKVSLLVNNTHELITSEVAVGSLVKVKNVGSGGWMLLEKYNDLATVDYTETYRVVGRQNGTVQFSDKLYNGYKAYDYAPSDVEKFDSYPSKELEIIFNSIKNNILVEDLRGEYLKLFFSSVRYALHEQLYVDWIFKTSFVKANHKVGKLQKRISHGSSNLSDFEDYITEVKPYKTKIREFISSYESLDLSQSLIADFDLQPAIDSNFKVSPVAVAIGSDGTIVGNSEQLASKPSRIWRDHIGFEVISIAVVDSGSGYTQAPQVVISQDSEYGRAQLLDGEPAVAKAYISRGKVTRIEVINPGSRWVSAPSVSLVGGIGANGVAARAVAIIGNSVVRSNLVSIKFDRLFKSNVVDTLTVSETFVSNGESTQYPLKWSPASAIDSYQVLVKDYNSNEFVEVLKTEYSLTHIESKSATTNTYSGLLTFASPLPKLTEIAIQYTKNINYLTAADRIAHYYKPSVGQLGKGTSAELDTTQLMTGVDYGGVVVTGTALQAVVGWDSSATSGWDQDTVSYDDGSVSISANYDADIAGGDLSVIDGTYQTAVGKSPSEIVIDGDGFVTPFTSHAPEEVVPGHVSDAVAIKVFARPSGGGTNMLSKTYVADGVQQAFDLGQVVYSTTVIVSVNNVPQQADVDYTIDFENMKVVFSTAPLKNTIVSILSFGANSTNALDLDYFVADGESSEFVTRAPWTPNVKAFVLVNGVAVNYSVFSTDQRYLASVSESWKARVGIRFEQTPQANAIVTYIVTQSSSEYPVCMLQTQSFNSGLDQTTFTLPAVLNINEPFDEATLVKVNNQFIKPPKYSYITMLSKNSAPVLVYELQDEVYRDIGVVNTSDIFVYSKHQKLRPGIDYTVDIKQHYPEFALDATKSTVFGGIGYAVNDIIEVVGGVVSGSPTAFKVTKVSLVGAIVSAMVIRIGAYFEVPVAPYQIVGGSGTGAVSNLQYEQSQDLNKFSISIHSSVFEENSKLTVRVTVGNDYSITDQNTLQLSTTYPENSAIEVISFCKNSVQTVERTQIEFDQVVLTNASGPNYLKANAELGGKITLDSPVPSGDHVWIIVDSTLLRNNVDYVLLPDYRTIELADNLSKDSTVDIISFIDEVIDTSYSYMQFKDMLNRVHYKRLNGSKATQLAAPLRQTDETIFVVDASKLDTPNPAARLPGIIEINGERIEYYTKNGSELGQLHRGTLGTGVPEEHPAGQSVQGIGYTETIPYKDTLTVETFVSDGVTSTFALQPANSNNTKDTVEVFVGGYRLKKNSYTLYTDKTWPYSNSQSDVVFDPEFDVLNNSVTLEAIPPEGAKITVVKKTGVLWNDLGERLGNSSTRIAKFVTSSNARWSNIN